MMHSDAATRGRHTIHHDEHASPFSDPDARFAAGRMGMAIFLISLAVLFVAGIVGYAVIRINFMKSAELTWPSDMPPLPLSLVLSTVILIASSCTLHGALNGIREDMTQRASRLMAATTVMGVGFMLLQAWAWSSWFASVGGLWEDSQPHRWALASFYVLTGIHALHVVGGLVPMFIVTIKAFRKRYSAAHYAGIYYCNMYWHFLGVVWLVLYLILLLGS